MSYVCRVFFAGSMLLFFFARRQCESMILFTFLIFYKSERQCNNEYLEPKCFEEI